METRVVRYGAPFEPTTTTATTAILTPQKQLTANARFPPSTHLGVPSLRLPAGGGD